MDNLGAGGSVGVAALRTSDDAEVTMSGNMATRIRATFLLTNPSKIEAIAKAGRTPDYRHSHARATRARRAAVHGYHPVTV